MFGCTHMQDDCQPAIVHEVAVSASGIAVCVEAHHYTTGVDTNGSGHYAYTKTIHDIMYILLVCM